jgi:hypothetical protein
LTIVRVGAVRIRRTVPHPIGGCRPDHSAAQTASSHTPGPFWRPKCLPHSELSIPNRSIASYLLSPTRSTGILPRGRWLGHLRGAFNRHWQHACRKTNWSRSHEQPKGRRHRKAGRRVQGHHRAGARLMVGYNLLFWLLMVAIVALLVLVATSFEGMQLDATGGPGRIL